MSGFNLFSAEAVHDTTHYDFDGHAHVQWIQEDDFQLTSQTPENYPKNCSPIANAYVDGCMYSDTVVSDLKNLFTLLDSEKLSQAAELIRDWDGEFVVMYATQKKIYVLSDSFGRLPVYYSNTNGEYIVSRNISFLRAAHTSDDVDRMQVAVSLLLGTQLGETTFWKSIRKAPPHSILEIDRSTNRLEVHRFFQLKTVNGKAKVEDVRDEIRSVFLDTLQRRLQFSENPTLSLSGGLDSRLIATALKEIDSDIPHITYSRDNNTDHLDHKSSQEITKRLGAENVHEIVTLGAPTVESADELLKIKQGFNFLSMSYIIPYYQLHRERNIATITGDGGGKYFVDLYPLRDLQSMNQLISYLLRYNAFCDFETAAGIAGVKKEALKAYVVDHIAAYPFEDFNDKYTYFLIREAGINWAFEGEDRNRQYSWSTTPFYNPKLIDLCLSIPQRSKKHGELYKYLYDSFPGELGAVSNPNWNEIVDNSKNVRRIHNRQKLKNYIPASILNYRKGITREAFYFDQELEELMTAWNSDLLDLTRLKSKHTTNFYWQLYTLMKLMK